MALIYTDFDLNKLTFAENVSVKGSRKTAPVSYAGTRLDWVGIQLGAPKEPLRCPFGVDAYENPQTGKVDSMTMKLELTPPTKEFAMAFEDTTLQAAADNSAKWFGKEFSKTQLETTFSSRIKAQKDETRPETLNLKVEFKDDDRKTEVVVSEWVGKKLTNPVKGTLEDIVKGSMVVPAVRVQGGVYFMGPGGKNFGTSMAAASVLVIKGSALGAASGGSSFAFDMGGVEMVDSEDEGPDGDSPKAAKVARVA